jgi:hypothetical protein
MLTHCAGLLEDHLFYLAKAFLIPDYSFEIKEERRGNLNHSLLFLCLRSYFKFPFSHGGGRSRRKTETGISKMEG